MDFSLESSNPKNIFCIKNLVSWQVYRVEKVGKYLHSLAKKNRFLNFLIGKIWVSPRKTFTPLVKCPINSGLGLKIFPLVKLTKLGRQNFKLDLNYSFESERSFGTATLKHYRTANTHSKVTVSSPFWR